MTDQAKGEPGERGIVDLVLIVAEKNAEIARLREARDDEQRARQSETNRANALTEEVARLRAEVAEAREEIEALDGDIEGCEEVIRARDARIAELEGEAKKAAKVIRTLYQRLVSDGWTSVPEAEPYLRSIEGGKHGE